MDVRFLGFLYSRWLFGIALAGLLVLGACSTGGLNGPTNPSTVTTNGDAIPGSSPEDIEVSGPLGSAATWDPASGSLQFEGGDTVGKVALMDTTRDFGWTATYPYWFSDLQTQAIESQGSSSYGVGPLSTAVDLVLLTPNVGTRDAALLPNIVEVLRSVPEVQALADFLETNASTADPIGLPGFPGAFEAAIIAAVEAIDAAGLVSQDLGAASAFPVDQVFTTARESGGNVTVEWHRDIWPINRTLTHHGVLYEVDTAAYEDESQLRQELTNEGYGVAPSRIGCTSGANYAPRRGSSGCNRHRRAIH